MPEFDGAESPADWSAISSAFGRTLDQEERRRVTALMHAYALQLAAELKGVKAADVLTFLQSLLDRLSGGSRDASSALQAFFHGSPENLAHLEARWLISPANGKYPAGKEHASVALVRQAARPLKDVVEMDGYLKAVRRGLEVPSVETPDGDWRKVDLPQPVRGRGAAMKPLILGLAELWEAENGPPTSRKDASSARSEAISGFVGFCDAILHSLPQDFRPNGREGLATAVAQVLSGRPQKQNPT